MTHISNSVQVEAIASNGDNYNKRIERETSENDTNYDENGKSHGAKSASSSAKDLYLCIRPFLIFGRLTMILPIHGVLNKNSSHLHYKKWGALSFASMVISIFLIFNGIAAVIGLFHNNNGRVPEIVWSSKPCIFFFIGSFGYLFILTRANSLITLLNKWVEHLRQLSFKMEDHKLNRDVNLIFVCIFTSAIMENLLQQLIQMGVLDISKSSNGNSSAIDTNSIQKNKLSPLESYWVKIKEPNWNALIPYHPLFSIFLFICNKWALYSWNYVDILIIIFARATSFHFKTILKYTETNIVNNLNDGLFDYDKWQKVARDFEILHSLLERMKKFLSPLVFTSFAVNLFYIIIHLHMSLIPSTSKNAAQEVYRTWSFVQISCRLYLMTFFSAKINEYAHEFLSLYRKCPSDCYSVTMQRAERFSGSVNLGLTGLNCFTVTKPFMLSLVSVILTFEIVLMQTSGFHGYFDE